MARRKKGGAEMGGANWMDTYGDLVTLLLCFFVLLYSMSSMDESKWQLIAQAFSSGQGDIINVVVSEEPNVDNDCFLSDDRMIFCIYTILSIILLYYNYLPL